MGTAANTGLWRAAASAPPCVTGPDPSGVYAAFGAAAVFTPLYSDPGACARARKR